MGLDFKSKLPMVYRFTSLESDVHVSSILFYFCTKGNQLTRYLVNLLPLQALRPFLCCIVINLGQPQASSLTNLGVIIVNLGHPFEIHNFGFSILDIMGICNGED